MATASPSVGDEFSFFKGGENVLATTEDKPFDWLSAAGTVRSQLADALGVRHLSFLLGSGCSSFKRDSEQVGIPTMAPMAANFLSEVGADDESGYLSTTERAALLNHLGLEVGAEKFQSNLESLMEALYGAKIALDGTTEEQPAKTAEIVDRVLEKIAAYILARCTTGPFSRSDDSVQNLYETFYRKLVFRDRSLPRPWVFTTNYDLFNERAMDRRGIPYCNGFSGVIERRFNPAMFRYSLAEQLDITSRKWTAVDSFVYLCKLHGSVNWLEDGQTLFPIRETVDAPPNPVSRMMIYPTPAKQGATFASPYADLFREFQRKVVQDQGVLITLGYGFGDQHVNNIIFQALTIPNFRLIAFVPENGEGVISQLRALQDPRIWLIGSDSVLSRRPAHFFETVVQDFLPELPNSKVEEAVAKVLKNLISPGSEEQSEPHGDG